MKTVTVQLHVTVEIPDDFEGNVQDLVCFNAPSDFVFGEVDNPELAHRRYGTSITTDAVYEDWD